MSKELQTLNERIADRVGKDLVDLIPPEQWQVLVDSQIRKFMTETAPMVIEEELTRRARKAISGRLNEIERSTEWDSSMNTYTNIAVNEMLKQSAPVVFAAMLEPAMSGFLSDLRRRFETY